MSSEQWNSQRWLKQFSEASATRHHDALHSLRASVFQSTIQVVRERGYHHGGRWNDLDGSGEYASLHKGTVLYESADNLEFAERRGSFVTRLRVENKDCLEAARDLGTSGDVPAVLNMASRRNPGGGVLGGAGAQEENLFRRSNLLWSLYQFADFAAEYGVPSNPEGHRYPLSRESGGIYSPPAWVFRSSEATGYEFLAAPYRAAFVTVPAIPRPDVRMGAGGLPRLTDDMAEATRRKIRAILGICANHGHADVVLGAFGCGAFRNPPRHMAQLFRETLEEPAFQGVFRVVEFAILDDHNAVRPESPEGLPALQGRTRGPLNVTIRRCHLSHALATIACVMTSSNDETDSIVDRILAGIFTDLGHAKDLDGDHMGALRLFEEAVRRNPGDALAWYNLGDTLLAMERAPQAAEALRQAASLAPTNPLFRYELGLALYHLEQYAEATEHLRAAVGPDPGLTRGQSNLGVNAVSTLALCEEACGDLGSAVATLEPARRHAVSILYNIGRLKVEAGDHADAHACLTAAALVAPDDEDVRHMAGVVLMELGRHDEAEEHLAHATALDTGCVEVWYARGLNLTRAGREGARECFEEVLRREPGHAGATEALEG